ncbi:Vestitone reductase [Spatholobus suberectus]|nr:Vestitone reductase [Spatholobus suberectus]
MEHGKGRVCVTGGTGFIGSWIVKRLLEDGYSVNTTVRPDPVEHKKDVSFLTSLPGASQRLQIFSADLSNPESFSAAIEGCVGVFHVATPVDFELKEPEEVVTKRSIDGTLGILKACLNSKTVKRVVYTSSASALNSNGKGEMVDESSWSDVDDLRASKPHGWSYAVSKTLTEKSVLEFGEQNGLDVVTLLPTSVFGPFICPQIPISIINILKEIYAGEKSAFGFMLQTPMVHVDDVARAHIFLLEHPNPKGRYNCSQCLVTFERISELVSAKYPEFQLETQTEGMKVPDLSSKKLTDSGFVFKYGLEEMLDDAIQCCKEKGLPVSQMEESKGRVCVTGGTGFIGSWIIKKLLQDGYSVNTTVRTDPEHKKDVSFLTSLPGASQRLQIFSADLSNPESFSAAIEGCIGVFHVATPIDFELKEPEEVVTKRTIEGTLSILKACLNSKTVKRVVYTSSASAVNFNGKVEMMDESYWSDVDCLRASKPFGWSYAVSKALTEKAVLEFGEQNGLDVVTLIPPFVFGPFICPKLPSSVDATLNFAFGNKGPFGLLLQTGMVHVDDVARAHIFLLEHSNPKGRYNCSQCLVTYERISELVSAKYPKFQPPTLDSLKQIEGIKFPGLSTKKLLDAGFTLKYGLEKMVDDAIQCCQEKGYLL